jgi:hypothetical protein
VLIYTLKGYDERKHHVRRPHLCTSIEVAGSPTVRKVISNETKLIVDQVQSDAHYNWWSHHARTRLYTKRAGKWSHQGNRRWLRKNRVSHHKSYRLKGYDEREHHAQDHQKSHSTDKLRQASVLDGEVGGGLRRTEESSVRATVDGCGRIVFHITNPTD